MGAYAALRAAVTQPELFERVVLIDGGLPLPVPPGVDADVVLEATVGPAVARLSQTFPTEESYVDFFKVHPALADSWSEDIEAYVRYDIAGEPGAFRSKVNPVAVRQDGRDLFLEAASYGEDLMRLADPGPAALRPARHAGPGGRLDGPAGRRSLGRDRAAAERRAGARHQPLHDPDDRHGRGDSGAEAHLEALRVTCESEESAKIAGLLRARQIGAGDRVGLRMGDVPRVRRDLPRDPSGGRGRRAHRSAAARRRRSSE